ncbi:MAG TPA: MCE family protein, partial [Mycolicibacterium fallax]|nr:MCE family protein [Mycolicibacterium fallax]
MTERTISGLRLGRGARLAVIAALVAILVAAAALLWPGRGGTKVVGLFSSAVGIYPGDEVRMLGVPVGRITAIEPRAEDVKITMMVDKSVQIPADARAIVISPNLVAARFIQLTPAYDGGPELADGAVLDLDHTGVPVEWDQVKEELTKLSAQLGPGPGGLSGPAAEFIDQAASTLDGNGDSFRTALREMSQVAGRLGDSRTDLFGTVRNLQVLVHALSESNEQLVQFSGHVASVSQVLADSSVSLDTTLASLNTALAD